MSTHLRVGREYFKGHGHGNDYLVMTEGQDVELTPDTIRALCDRWRGVGSDGLVVLLDGPEAGVRLRMFNPDGSEFERSGNGLRVVAAYLHSSGTAGHEPFTASVGGQTVTLRVHAALPGGGYDVSVEMGRAVVLDLEGHLGALDAVAVSVGNPHCVVFTEDLSDEALDRWGPELTGHEAFPGGTNVQLARVDSAGTVRIRIWERGVGPTSSSGTSACAVAVAVVHTRRAEAGTMEVQMDGGSFEVEVRPDFTVVLRGPVQAVTEGVLTKGFTDGLKRG